MKLKITAAFLSLVGTSFGASINLQSVGANYNGTDDMGILLSNNSPVAYANGMARVGVFATLSDANVTTLVGNADYTTLFADYQTLASDNFTAVNTAYGATAGFMQVNQSGVNVSSYVGKTLYAYFTSGTEIGLFKTTTTLAADPSLPSPETSYFLSMFSGTAMIGGAGPTYVVNPYQGAPGNITIQNSFKLINPVPEPSVALLGSIGVLGLLRRRRN